jgi:hypothetical protein
MRYLSLAILLAASILMSVEAAAQARAVEGECRAMSGSHAPAALWWGRFSGGKEMMGLGDGDMIVTHTEDRCFTAQAACRSWLYALKSEYGFAPGWNECRRGFDPGASVRAWWKPGQ